MASSIGVEAVIERFGRAVERVVVLDREQVQRLLVAWIAGGHVLIEGVPGVGKTVLARTLATLAGLSFRRVQFTNDLMPSDVLGGALWRPDEGAFEFQPGPIFTHVLLADEINRSSPRTLSCLLEAMEQGRVSLDGTTHHLPDPFFVLATRNPIEFHGTFPMPEAALDRFLLHVELGYPERDAELELYRRGESDAAVDTLEPVLTAEELTLLREAAARVAVSEPVLCYVHGIVQASRDDEGVASGISPRAALAWLRAARAHALLEGREYVLPDDLRALALPVLAHRIARRDGQSSNDGVRRWLDQVPVER